MHSHHKKQPDSVLTPSELLLLQRQITSALRDMSSASPLVRKTYLPLLDTLQETLREYTHKPKATEFSALKNQLLRLSEEYKNDSGHEPFACLEILFGTCQLTLQQINTEQHRLTC